MRELPWRRRELVSHFPAPEAALNEYFVICACDDEARITNRPLGLPGRRCGLRIVAALERLRQRWIPAPPYAGRPSDCRKPRLGNSAAVAHRFGGRRSAILRGLASPDHVLNHLGRWPLSFICNIGLPREVARNGRFWGNRTTWQCQGSNRRSAGSQSVADWLIGAHCGATASERYGETIFIGRGAAITSITCGKSLFEKTQLKRFSTVAMHVSPALQWSPPRGRLPSASSV